MFVNYIFTYSDILDCELSDKYINFLMIIFFSVLLIVVINIQLCKWFVK